MFDDFSWIAFILTTVCVAGGAAWMTGRAIALTWRPAWMAIAYALLLGAASRFIYFALLSAEDKLGPESGQVDLLSLPYYALDAVTLIAITLIAYRFTRARQMVAQYPWLYQMSGPLGWKELPDS
ncbi:MAG: hypothetical protein Alpg2KO_28090 [Alphaproteobacteria bacterium]